MGAERLLVGAACHTIPENSLWAVVATNGVVLAMVLAACTNPRVHIVGSYLKTVLFTSFLRSSIILVLLEILERLIL